MEYKIARGEKRFSVIAMTDLESEVNYLISIGWEPVGGVSVETDTISNAVVYTQAMIRRV